MRKLFLAALFALASALIPALAHDIPGDTRIHAFARPEGDRLHVLLRIPLELLTNLNLPKRGVGYLDLPNVETGLHPGMTVKAAFQLGEERVLRVPAAALVRRSEITAVYVIENGRVGLRQIRPGHRVGAEVEVLSGLDPGERIAVDPLAARLWLAGAPRVVSDADVRDE